MKDWQKKLDGIKKYIADNKQQLDGVYVSDFVSHLALLLGLSPITVRTSYLKILEFQGIIKVTDYGIVKVLI